MNENKLADVLILARGGGSLEDLWPFNEEVVARAIFESEIPIISAVGHETDFTISDFVADLRAPTPSAAAELAVTDIEDLKYTIKINQNRLRNSLKKKVEVMRLNLEKIMNSRVYKNPYQKINDLYVKIDRNVKSIEKSITKKVKESKLKAIEQIAKLDALSPLKTLTRGYSIVQKDDKVITSVKQLKKDDEIDIKLKDGQTKAIIKM